MEKEIAKVDSTFLGWEDHGIFTSMIHLDYGNGAQGAGGYSLDQYNETIKRRIGTAYGMEFIIRTMKAFGVREWDKIQGKTIFALKENGMVVGFEPLPTEKGEIFLFKELGPEMESMK